MANQTTSFVASNTPVNGVTYVTSEAVATDLLNLINDYNLTIGTNKIADLAVTAAKIETQQAWIALSLVNSWANYAGGYNPAGYMKDSMGFVHLRGMLDSGISPVVATLPTGYRPENNEIFPYREATLTNGHYISIANTGVIQSSTGSTYVSLDGIIFKAV